MKQFVLNTEKSRIEFIDSRFYLSDKGNYLPSVTTILDAFPKDASYFKWLKDVGNDADFIRDEAGRRGSTVHELTERYDSGEEVTFLNQYGSPAFKLNEWAMFERYVEFMKEQKPSIDMMEVHIASDKLGFAGTLDRVITTKGNECILLDIKTSNSIYPSYWLQLAAYLKLIEGAQPSRKINKVGILWLNAKTRTQGKGNAIQGIGWQLVTKDMKEVAKDWKLFKATHDLWKSLNEDIKPRNLSYQVKHKK